MRQWLQKFGVWVVIAASAWLTWHLVDVYDFSEIWRRDGAGGFPNFFQGIDLVVALPVSWLPLVCDYNRFGRRAGSAAVGTYIGYAIANAWFFTLGMLYVQALQTDPGVFVDALVTTLLPLALGWLALIVLLAGEIDEVFANVYSTAVSIQNLASKLKHWMLALAVGFVATIAAANLDLLGYETFLLLIGGVFVPVFGILLADYFVLRGGDYLWMTCTGPQARTGMRGALIWWRLSFGSVDSSYMLSPGQPPWLIEHVDFVVVGAGRGQRTWAARSPRSCSASWPTWRDRACTPIVRMLSTYRRPASPRRVTQVDTMQNAPQSQESSPMRNDNDPLIIAGKEFRSRLIVGTGKYRSMEEMRDAIDASGAEMVTVAIRRLPLDPDGRARPDERT